VTSLRGERVSLDAVRAEHVERLMEMRASPEVERWWEPPPEGWPLEAEPQVQSFVILSGGEPAGFLQFAEEPDPAAKHADVDIFLGPAYQDQGLGTDALRAIVRHLIEERGHHRITLGTSVDNSRAIRCYEKVGFRTVGTLRKAALSHRSGQWEDELLMELVV
jgi:aminoglycoside 6'-N-acetyltransferase